MKYTLDFEDLIQKDTRRGDWRLGERGEGVEKHRSVVTKYPQGCELQHRKYNQSCGND